MTKPQTHTPSSYTLVLSGCGTVFFTYIGVMRALESSGVLLEEIVTTSGGAIIGSMTAHGYNSLEIETIAKHIKLTDFQDWSWNPLHNMGLLNGTNLLKFLNKTVPGKLEDLKIPFIAMTTDAETKKSIPLGSKTTGNVATADAVRASMSIPLLFKYHEVSGLKLIDGGTTNNFNIDGFPAHKTNIIGVRLKGVHPDKPVNLTNPANYIGQVIDCMMEANEREHIEDSVYAKILELRVPFDALSFNHTKEDIDKMIALGFDSMTKWLKEIL